MKSDAFSRSNVKIIVKRKVQPSFSSLSHSLLHSHEFDLRSINVLRDEFIPKCKTTFDKFTHISCRNIHFNCKKYDRISGQIKNIQSKNSPLIWGKIWEKKHYQSWCWGADYLIFHWKYGKLMTFRLNSCS